MEAVEHCTIPHLSQNVLPAKVISLHIVNQLEPIVLRTSSICDSWVDPLLFEPVFEDVLPLFRNLDPLRTLDSFEISLVVLGVQFYHRHLGHQCDEDLPDYIYVGTHQVIEFKLSVEFFGELLIQLGGYSKLLCLV